MEFWITTIGAVAAVAAFAGRAEACPPVDDAVMAKLFKPSLAAATGR